MVAGRALGVTGSPTDGAGGCVTGAGVRMAGIPEATPVAVRTTGPLGADTCWPDGAGFGGSAVADDQSRLPDDSG